MQHEHSTQSVAHVYIARVRAREGAPAQVLTRTRTHRVPTRPATHARSAMLWTRRVFGTLHEATGWLDERVSILV